MCRSPCGDGADFGHIEYPDSSDSEPQIKFQISNDLEKWSTNTKQTHTNVNCTRCVSDFRVNSPVCLPVCNNGSIMFCFVACGFLQPFLQLFHSYLLMVFRSTVSLCSRCRSSSLRLSACLPPATLKWQLTSTCWVRIDMERSGECKQASQRAFFYWICFFQKWIKLLDVLSS